MLNLGDLLSNQQNQIVMKKLSITLLIFSLLAGHLLAQNEVTTEEFGYYCPICNSQCDEKEYKAEGRCVCGMQLVKQSKKERAKVMQTNSDRTTIAFYLQNGIEVLDFAGPLEVFAYAGFEVFTVSKTVDPILSQGVLKVTPDYSIEDAPQADIVAFFGGNAGVAAQDPDVIKWITQQQATVDYFFSVCTGAFILGQAGLLDNQTVTTFHSALANLEKSFPKANVLSDVRFVDNGKIITTAGISAGIDGALHLVSKLRGEEEAKRTAFYMEYDKWVPNEGLILDKSLPAKENVNVSNN